MTPKRFAKPAHVWLKHAKMFSNLLISLKVSDASVLHCGTTADLGCQALLMNCAHKCKLAENIVA